MSTLPDEPGLVFDLRDEGTSVVFGLKVQPGAKRTAIVGTWQTSLKVKIGRKPEDGAANRECIAFLADVLGVPRKQIAIIKGEFSPTKVVRVTGATSAEVRPKLIRAWRDQAAH